MSTNPYQLTRAVTQPMPVRTAAAEEFIEKLADSLQIADSRYEEAERSYQSVGKWLGRSASKLAFANPSVSPQGSFALGTVIKPVSEAEEYDIDLICVFNVDQNEWTQKALKDALMVELKAYAEAHGMQNPEPHRRCVRVHYAEGAQFHLDATPAVPDKNRTQFLLENHGIKNEWSSLAVCITDNEGLLYGYLSRDWPHSNPRGYVRWFRSRMQPAFERSRRAMAMRENKSNVEEIPDYRVQTPLQSAIQLLKRHRDMTYDGEPEHKPISIIITTLAALAYDQETTIQEALFKILFNMERFIKRDVTGRALIQNPTDPLENFADKWHEHSEREEAFFDWLRSAQTDLVSIAGLTSLKDIAESLAPAFGPKLVEAALLRTRPDKVGVSLIPKWNILQQPHKKPVPWPTANAGRVKIQNATYRSKARGSIWRSFEDNGAALPKNCDLIFEAVTNIPEPYEVYWQVVNTGKDAVNGSGLRGGIERGNYELGKLRKKEETSYRGSHTIECFLVSNETLLARSGPFIVNIR